MKPVIIIAIAVVCSVVAVFTVLIAIEEYQFWRFEMALEEVEKERLSEEDRQRLDEVRKKALDDQIKNTKEEARLQYSNLDITKFYDQYSNCLNDNMEGFCFEILSDVVSDYCNEKLPSFSVSPDDLVYAVYAKCVSITNQNIIQNEEIAIESDKIPKCFDDYAGRDDRNIALICIRTWN